MPAPTTARAQIRLACVAALEAAVAAGSFAAAILSPGDWNQPPEKLPAILLRTPSDVKRSGAKAQPNFTTEVTLEIQAFAAGTTTDVAAQTAIELLDAWIEQTLFTAPAVLALVQQVASVETVTKITAAGKEHFAGVEKRIVLETFEDFEPTITQPLTEITLTYVSEVFTAAAAAAGQSVLTFASGALPPRIDDGWIVTDATTTGAIPNGTTVSGITATTITLSAPLTGSGVAAGDRIVFQPPNPTVDVDLPQ